MFFFIIINYLVYLALPECCLDHIVPKLINQDMRQLGVIDKLMDDHRALWLPRFFQASFHHIAAALLDRQISVVTLQPVQYFVCCPTNLELEYVLYYIIPAERCSYAY